MANPFSKSPAVNRFLLKNSQQDNPAKPLSHQKKNLHSHILKVQLYEFIINRI